MSTLQSKIAWVTGAGTGIGLAGAQALARGGATVVLSGRRAEVLQREADAIKKSGGKAEVEALDVSDAASVKRVADAILARHGKVDILVNSAGLNNPQRYWRDQTVESWDQYHNMRSVIEQHPRIVANAEEAIRRAGVEPVRSIIRGGTDGARLTAMGLPTPNLFTGGHDYHSPREWASLQEMAAASATVVRLAGVWARDGAPLPQ